MYNTLNCNFLTVEVPRKALCAVNWHKVKISSADLIKDEDYKDPFDIEKEKSNLFQEKVENIKKFKDVDEEYEHLGSTLKDD